MTSIAAQAKWFLIAPIPIQEDEPLPDFQAAEPASRTCKLWKAKFPRTPTTFDTCLRCLSQAAPAWIHHNQYMKHQPNDRWTCCNWLQSPPQTRKEVNLPGWQHIIYFPFTPGPSNHVVCIKNAWQSRRWAETFTFFLGRGRIYGTASVVLQKYAKTPPTRHLGEQIAHQCQNSSGSSALVATHFHNVIISSPMHTTYLW